MCRTFYIVPMEKPFMLMLFVNDNEVRTITDRADQSLRNSGNQWVEMAAKARALRAKP